MKPLDKKLNKAFADYIKARDPRCIICWNPTTDCAHLFAGRHASTKWDERCAFGTCHTCHMAQHQDKPSILRDVVIERYGEERYDFLLRLNNMGKRWTEDEKKELLQGLTQKDIWICVRKAEP